MVNIINIIKSGPHVLNFLSDKMRNTYTSLLLLSYNYLKKSTPKIMPLLKLQAEVSWVHIIVNF